MFHGPKDHRRRTAIDGFRSCSVKRFSQGRDSTMHQRPPHPYETTDPRVYQPQAASWSSHFSMPAHSLEGYAPSPPTSSHPAFLASEWSRLQQEVGRLRNVMAHLRADRDRIVASAEERFYRVEQQQREQYEAKLSTLESELDEARSRLRAVREQTAAQLKALQAEKTRHQDALQASHQHVESLKQELKHVAEAASQEQHALAAEHQRFVEQHAGFVDEHTTLVRNLESELAAFQSRISEQDDSITLWRQAHDDAVELCESLETQLLRRDQQFHELRERHSQFQHRSAEAFAILEDEIQVLESTAKMLRTDHEDIELINCHLDHRNDELESLVELLQRDLDGVVLESTREKQESRRALAAFQQRMDACELRVNAATEEKRSLNETVARLKAAADESDAALFAKDQEIAATRKAAHQTEQRLAQVQQQHTAATGELQELRNELRSVHAELQTTLDRLQVTEERLKDSETRLHTSEERFETAEGKLAESDRQLRELQSAARAAEANAVLRAQEAEQQHLAEIERLETELEARQSVADREAQRESERDQHVQTLESELHSTRQALAASSRENDRLQQTVEHLGTQIVELTTAAHERDERIASLNENVRDTQNEVLAQTDQVTQLRTELSERRSQTAEYADQLATAQHVNEQLRQQRDAIEKQLADARDQNEQSRKEISQLQEELARKAESDQTELDKAEAELRQESEREQASLWQQRLLDLESEHLRQRERDHQVQVKQQITIDQLTESAEQIATERDALRLELETVIGVKESLEDDLRALNVHADPIAEVKRLTTELARRSAEHARERETLYRRIEQLQVDRTLWRAA